MFNPKRVLVPLLCFLICTAMPACDNSDSVSVRFPSGDVVQCELADTAREQIDGLSTYDHLDRNQGMLFYYKTPRKGLTFWMPARMNFSLDMIFLNEEKKIIHIARNVPVCESNLPEECPSYGPSPGKQTQFVVEVVAGFSDDIGLRLGDTLHFTLP